MEELLKEREIALFNELKNVTGEDHFFILNELIMVRSQLKQLN